jgi:mannose-6-phosphate isomerase-like protein (cupin superfamily)
MEASITPTRDCVDAPALPAADFRAFVRAALSDNRLLRALSAGWLTADDMATVVPYLAFQHDVATRSIHAIPYSATAMESVAVPALDVCARQIREFDKALRAVRGARLPEEKLPAFARHFSERSSATAAQATPETAVGVCRAAMLIEEQVLAGLGRAPEKAEAAQARLDRLAVPEAQWDVGVDEIVEAVLLLHLEFLDALYDAMRFERVRGLSDRIQARISLESEAEPPIAMYPGVGDIMCEERDEKRGIEFTVERYPCTAEVLDPRVVRIPPGKTNNRHKHAHETLFYFIEGVGEILVGEKWIPVKPGDAVFSPRWAIHQTRNTGTTQLTLLAITDYYLTSQVYVGKYDKI